MENLALIVLHTFEIFRDIYDDLISNGLLQELVGDIQNSDFHYNDEHHYGSFY